MFIPLKLMFPGADIPVVQLSLRENLDPAAHLAAGKALSVLRDEGVLIVGSGMSFHNMSGYGNPQFTPLSEAFDDWLSRAVEASPEQRRSDLTDGRIHCVLSGLIAAEHTLFKAEYQV